MQYFPQLETKSIDEISPGTCFAFELRQQTHIGVAIQPLRGETPALIAVSPGHPDLGGKVGLFDGSVVLNQSLLVFPEAQIVLPTERKHIHIGLNTFATPPGILLLINGRLGVSAFDGSQTRVYDASDGTPIKDDLVRSVWFSSWEIVSPLNNGEWQTICRVTHEAASNQV